MTDQEHAALTKLAVAADRYNIYRINVRCEGTVQGGQYTSTWRIQCYTPIEVSSQAYSLAAAAQLFITNLEAAVQQPVEDCTQLLLLEDGR